MTGAGEFGGDAPGNELRLFGVFCSDSSATGHAIATSAVVPSGETWVLLGVDCVGGGVGSGYVAGTAQLVGVCAFLEDTKTFTAPASSASVIWRGWLAIEEGQSIQVDTVVSTAGSVANAVAWGYKLPFQ